MSKDTIARLDKELPAAWSHGNPVDVLGDVPPERIGKAVEIVLADNGVDGVLAIALDARIVLDHNTVLHPVRPYSHLAIRPYPEEFTKRTKLKDGTSILLRAIRPEDEPMWHELLRSCSPESLHLRFRYMFKATTHEMATRFCFIDADREIAIVAEIEVEDERKLIGVGRLVADADHREAEFAILIGEPVGSFLQKPPLCKSRRPSWKPRFWRMPPGGGGGQGHFEKLDGPGTGHRWLALAKCYGRLTHCHRLH